MPNPGPNIFHKQHFSRSVCFSLGPVRVCCSPKLYIGIWLLVVRNGFFDKSQKDTTIKKFDFKEFIRTKTMRQRAKLRKRVQTILINKERFSKELHWKEAAFNHGRAGCWIMVSTLQLYLEFDVQKGNFPCIVRCVL